MLTEFNILVTCLKPILKRYLRPKCYQGRRPVPSAKFRGSSLNQTANWPFHILFFSYSLLSSQQHSVWLAVPTALLNIFKINKYEMIVDLALLMELEGLLVELTKARHFTLNNISHSTILCPRTWSPKDHFNNIFTYILELYKLSLLIVFLTEDFYAT
jgi:hypothetical protein